MLVTVESARLRWSSAHANRMRSSRRKCESHTLRALPGQKKVGAQSENGKSWAPGTPRLARLVCMASSDPLPGPDAKSPAFPNDFFSHELGRLRMKFSQNSPLYASYGASMGHGS